MKRSARKESVTACAISHELPLASQAIFMRCVEYFTSLTQTDDDDLDEFVVSSFIVGNDLQFDLRRYRLEPYHTATLFLEYTIRGEKEVGEACLRIAEVFGLPAQAIGWRRGQPMDMDVRRIDGDNLREAEARLLCLKIAAKCPNHRATTEYIKEHVENIYEPTELDMKPFPSRLSEPRWRQIVGNVISHPATSRGPFELGLAVRDGRYLQVTERGLSYLKSFGFLS